MFSIKPFPLAVGIIVLFLWARPAHAFGAGNIAALSKVEGQNCEFDQELEFRLDDGSRS